MRPGRAIAESYNGLAELHAVRQIKVGSLLVTPADKKLINEILDSNQISPGPVVRAFEDAFSKSHGAKYGLFVNSGTDALRVALATMKEVHGWKDDDLVAVPAVTFVATVNIILQCRLKPFFVDVSMYDFNLNPWNLERRMESKIERLRCVIPVHLFGKPCDAKVYELAKKYNLKVIEDSCETMGVQGIQGDIACFSTYICHMISTGIGGLTITNDKGYAQIMRSYANHGRNIAYLPGRVPCKDITKRFQFDRIGYSSRVTELEAALGFSQLADLPKSIARRREIAAKLNHGLRHCRDLVLPGLPDKHAFMMFPLCIKETSLIKKWELCRYLEKRRIETRELMPIVGQPCYQFYFDLDPQEFSVAAWVADKGFYIGCHPGMTDADVNYVVDVFETYLLKN